MRHLITRDRPWPTARLFLAVAVLLALSIGVGRSTDQPLLTAGSLKHAANLAGFAVTAVEFVSPRPVRPRHEFASLRYDDARLEALRARFKLDALVATAADEWSAQQILKDYVYRSIPDGQEGPVRAVDAMDILERARRGEEFFCTQFAITYVEAALSLGWRARRLAVDRRQAPDENESTNHGIAEVWSNQFVKWVAIDAQSNVHYEKAGVPLSAREVRAEWLRNAGADVVPMIGTPARPVARGIRWWNREGESETAAYFWIAVYDDAVFRDDVDSARLIFPQDSANASLVWYQNQPDGDAGRVHSAYRLGRFLPTFSWDDAYWTIGVVETRLVSASGGRVLLDFDVYSPNPPSFEVALNGGGWQRILYPSIAWKLQAGENDLRVRVSTARGVSGPETRLRLVLASPSATQPD
jgi:hypothetical protein